MEFPNDIYKSKSKIVKEPGVYWCSTSKKYLFYDGVSDFVETEKGEKIKKQMYGVTNVYLLTENNLKQTFLRVEKKANCFKNWQNRLEEITVQNS